MKHKTYVTKLYVEKLTKNNKKYFFDETVSDISKTLSYELSQCIQCSRDGVILRSVCNNLIPLVICFINGAIAKKSSERINKLAELLEVLSDTR